MTLFEELEATLTELGPEPIGEWMRKQGFPPEQSLLFLPQWMWLVYGGPLMPSYVKFSPFVCQPVLAHNLFGSN